MNFIRYIGLVSDSMPLVVCKHKHLANYQSGHLYEVKTVALDICTSTVVFDVGASTDVVSEYMFFNYEDLGIKCNNALMYYSDNVTWIRAKSKRVVFRNPEEDEILLDNGDCTSVCKLMKCKSFIYSSWQDDMIYYKYNNKSNTYDLYNAMGLGIITDDRDCKKESKEASKEENAFWVLVLAIADNMGKLDDVKNNSALKKKLQEFVGTEYCNFFNCLQGNTNSGAMNKYNNQIRDILNSSQNDTNPYYVWFFLISVIGLAGFGSYFVVNSTDHEVGEIDGQQDNIEIVKSN